MSNKDILNLHQQWLAFEAAGQDSEVLSLCSEDVCWFVPGVGALRGKTAVRQWLTSQPLSSIENIETFSIEIETSDKLAIKKAEFITKIRMPDSSELISIHGAHLWTLRRETHQGNWKVTNLSWIIVHQNP